MIIYLPIEMSSNKKKTLLIIGCLKITDCHSKEIKETDCHLRGDNLIQPLVQPFPQK